MNMMSKEEIETLYGIMPDNLDVGKMNTLLSKQENKHLLIENVYSDIIHWLSEIENISITENVVEYVKTINLNNNILLIVVDDYSVYNKQILGSNISYNIHKKFVSEGFRVVWIKKFEWENPSKQIIIKSLIIHSLGKTKDKIYARNTICEVIDNKLLKDFFNKSSFYGYRIADTAVCLKDKHSGEIVSAMSFGHPYYGKNKYDVECIRSASKPFTMVVGGLSKMMNFYLETFKTNNIVYYVDESHYQNKSIEKLGFKYSHFSPSGFHNVFLNTGSVFMRTPKLYKEIKFLRAKNIIVQIPDVGTSVFVYNRLG